MIALRAHALALVAVFALAGSAPAALAQGRPAPQRPPARAPEKEKEKEPAPPPDLPTPYDRDLMRLSEIVGALAFLRELCASPDAPEWKARMGAILDSEGTTPGRKERLAGAYNRGFRGYALTYRVCTPAAVEASARFIGEGERLSQSLAGRFGG